MSSTPPPEPWNQAWDYLNRHDDADIALVQDRLARLWEKKGAEDTLLEAAEKLSAQARALASTDEGHHGATKKPKRKRRTRARLPDRSKVSKEDKEAALALARKKGLL